MKSNEKVDKEDRQLMKAHILVEDDYRALYEETLSNTKAWGIDAMTAIQAKVIKDYEVGVWD